MLKFLKIFPLLILCTFCLRAQKDTFYLTNKKVHVGSIHKDYGDDLDIDTQLGPVVIQKNKLYKTVSADGKITKYQDLTYLEKGLSQDDYRKTLKPLSAKVGLFGQNLYYGTFHISRNNFFDALSMVQDNEITKSVARFKRKNKISQTLVPLGWSLQTVGIYSILTLASDIHFRNGGIYYYYDQSAFIIYAGGTMILAGLINSTIGYTQAIVARKIKKRKLIDRYNSLILQP